ncbi:MAG: nickel-responsive transcriptional regulator NikR [Candidatus Omnitrophica bacterium]|jgi:CopG family nickel-responsive transcriptional regulator|nr:nickel-responsive transcriptional regulator NikR [Candidatus Omnitrophota bacterium]
MKTIKRFGVSLEEDLFKELDLLVKKHKFPNRSQAIRFLIRQNMSEEAWQENKEVSGAVVLIYDHHKRDLVNKSLSIQHEFSHIILATQHVHLDHNSCLEIIALKGKAENLKVLSDKLIALKGIKHGKLVMS